MSSYLTHPAFLYRSLHRKVEAGDNETGPGSNYAANCSAHCTGSDHHWEGGGSFYGPTSILYSKSFDGYP